MGAHAGSMVAPMLVGCRAIWCWREGQQQGGLQGSVEKAYRHEAEGQGDGEEEPVRVVEGEASWGAQGPAMATSTVPTSAPPHSL